MSISVVVVGVNDWEKYTQKLIDDLSNLEAEIICIDNGSEIPYPKQDCIYRLDRTVSYAEALNYGIELAHGDWLVLTNNDVRIFNPIVERIEKLDKNKLYGFYMHDNVGCEYLSGWCYFLHRKLLDRVGLFDEQFKPIYFEDADYSIRAVKAGFALELLKREDWGIKHDPDRGGVRNEIKHKYADVYKSNMNYLKGKHGL